MSFRTRAFLILLAAVLVPLGVLAMGVRKELGRLIEREQTERLRALRDRRNPERATAAVRELTAAAREDRNLLPPILDCVRAEVTLGEISDALREVYGEYREAGLD